MAPGESVAPGGTWPLLPWREWEPTISTLHMWTQIVGKVRMALAPPRNHWWHVPLYLSSRGLTTSAIPWQDTSFQVDFDFVEHRLRVTDGNPGAFTMALGPISVARFYRDYRDFMAGLAGRGIDVRISTRPVEVQEAIPFEADEQHAAYEPGHVASLWQALLRADRVMKTFQSGFVGKASPVHLFWGGFDLTTSRYSGRPAPLHAGGIPNCPDWVMQESASREEIVVGWWPLADAPGPAFFAYTYPEPEGYRAAAVRPAGAFFDGGFGEFRLPCESLADAPNPDAAVLDFFQSTYDAGADLAGWDRTALEPSVHPGRPPRRPWSTLPAPG